MTTAGAVTALIATNWDEALDGGRLGRLRSASENPRVLILVDLGAARVGDPAYLPPATVEAVIDLIHARSEAIVDLAASSDETRLWAGNRDVHALADLLGYRFRTDGGHDYDIVDLGGDLIDGDFAEGSVLHGTQLCADWLEADVRLNLVRLRPDPAEGFAAGVSNLLCCLPLADKALHYRHRRDAGEVLSAVLDRCPPHLTLVEVPSPEAGAGCIVAAMSPVLADYAAALKTGCDPFASPLLAAVARRHPLPAAPRIDGSLRPVPALPAPDPLRQASAQARQLHEGGERLLAGWLRGLDPALFPAARPLDAKAGELVAALAGNGSSPSGGALIAAANLALAAAGQATQAWRTLFDKDALHRRAVALGFDPQAIAAADYHAIVSELDALLPLAASAPQRGPGLRWRKHDNAVLFQYSRAAPIPFDLFVSQVDVARTISAMNDYLGGTIVVVERDMAGRPVRQAERNLYLPQPNYTVLYGGQPIDVSKIEVVRYEPDAHRLYWKTLHSSNGSATADDGVAFFTREGQGTRVTIAGKQRFTLPPLLRVLDMAKLPALETPLTTDAYQRFFDRTFANFEALVEGRDIRLGRAADEPTEHPSVALEDGLKRLAEQAAPWLERLKPAVEAHGQAEAAPRPQPDDRGFVHVVPRR